MRAKIAGFLVERALELSAPGHDVGRQPDIAQLLGAPQVVGLSPADVLSAAIAAGRAVLDEWSRAYPDQTGPPSAIGAAEAWAAAPSPELADAAARAAELAVRQSIAVWRDEPKSAAWAGRTAAWVAAAPKYGWPAVAALFGACQAAGISRVVAAVAESLPRPTTGHA
jgi:hypothetical protein